MTESTVSPEEAFAILGNETRIDIVRVLGEAQRDSLSFSELRERVGTHDSGQFNYHLNRLVDRYIRQTDDGKYELSYAGSRVIGAIVSGEFTQSVDTETIPLESNCLTCTTQLEATYENERVAICCPDCDEVETGFGFPPGGIEDRTPAELTHVFDTWLKNFLRLTREEICHNCTGTITGRITAESEYLHEDEPVCLEFVCDRCADAAVLSVSSYLLFHPDVIGFHYEHDIDLHTIDLWNVASFTDPTVTTFAENPWEIETTFELEGDHVTIVIDDDLTAYLQ